MSDARIRRWVGRSISEGNTLEWGMGWSVKLSMELSISIIASIFLTEFSYRILGFEVFNDLVGVDTSAGIFAFFTGYIFREIMFCEYDIRDKD